MAWNNQAVGTIILSLGLNFSHMAWILKIKKVQRWTKVLKANYTQLLHTI